MQSDQKALYFKDGKRYIFLQNYQITSHTVSEL